MPGEIHYVHGPPGTGKTYFLQQKVAQSVDEYGADKVLVCSLTKTAAGEILARGVDLPKGQVGTLHSICFRALGVTKDLMVDESERTVNDGRFVNNWDTFASRHRVSGWGSHDRGKAGGNILFCDGHIEFFDATTIIGADHPMFK